MPTTDPQPRNRSKSDWSTFWPTFVVTVIGTVLVGGVMAVAVAWISAEIQKGIDQEAASIATCENPQQLRLLSEVSGMASSELQYTDANGTVHTYPAKNLVDGSRQTAWIAALEDGGVGAEITLRLPSLEDVRLICILNGYAKTSDVYDANGSVRVLQVATENGVREAALPRVTDANVFSYQALVFAPGPTQELTLTVQAADVPAASLSFGPASATISEIELWIKD